LKAGGGPKENGDQGKTGSEKGEKTPSEKIELKQIITKSRGGEKIGN